MSKDLNPQKALIFRITHKGNITRVLTDGCHCRSTAMAQPGYVEIGNQELIQRRNVRPVPCEPGGTLADYVPFYFTPYTPMMYNIKTGYGVPKQPVADIVILVSSLHVLRKKNVPFVFSDRHAYLKAAQFSTDLADLDWIIWSTPQQRDFKKDDADKFEKYQAEALVYKHVPIDALLGIVCYNDSVRAAVQADANAQAAAVKILSEPRWYL
jgi:hypothetical protein